MSKLSAEDEQAITNLAQAHGQLNIAIRLLFEVHGTSSITQTIEQAKGEIAKRFGQLRLK